MGRGRVLGVRCRTLGENATATAPFAGAKPADVSEQQWWARAARPGLAALAEQGLVERPTTKTYAIDGEWQG